nr:immunoglobulin heavy chain junction region [Mus musculus]
CARMDYYGSRASYYFDYW